jgi:hypothetical protein
MTIRFIQPLNHEKPAPIEVLLDDNKAEIRLICVQRNDCLTLRFKAWNKKSNRASDTTFLSKV